MSKYTMFILFAVCAQRIPSPVGAKETPLPFPRPYGARGRVWDTEPGACAPGYFLTPRRGLIWNYIPHRELHPRLKPYAPMGIVRHHYHSAKRSVYCLK